MHLFIEQIISAALNYGAIDTQQPDSRDSVPHAIFPVSTVIQETSEHENNLH